MKQKSQKDKVKQEQPKTKNKETIKSSKVNPVTKNKKQEIEEKKLEIQKQRNKSKVNQDTNKFYVTNKVLMEELIKWRDSSPIVEERQPSEKLGQMFLDIAKRLTNHSYFRNYTQDVKEECVGCAVLKCVSGLKNYNFKFTNPFAYFTQSCFNAFKTCLSHHYKQINIRRSLKKIALTDLESAMPNSGMTRCLDNGLMNDDYYDCE